MTREAAYIVSDILADPLARVTGFGTGGPLRGPWPIPVKTGTSKNFRDNWCLGYTPDYVIGVWAGNFQALPMNRVSGVTGAGHLWRAVANLLTSDDPPPPRVVPPGVVTLPVCPITGLLAGPDCPNHRLELFIASLPTPPECDHSHREGPFPSGRPTALTAASRARAYQAAATGAEGLRYPHGARGRAPERRLLSPRSGDVFALDPGLPAEYQRLRAIIEGGGDLDELVLNHNGRRISRQTVHGPGRTAAMVPLVKGRQTLEAVFLSSGRVVGRHRIWYDVR
jgi:membrane carboxypeptidase/penicillin-binding protein PbpC